MSKNEFLSGLTIGLCGKGDPIFKGSGKMLYNSVALPDINSVWTDELKATHPYAILQSYQYTYRLVLLQALPYCHYALNQYLIAIPKGNHEMYYPSDGKWAYLGKNTGGSSVAYSFVWTSCDILYKDSTDLYLAASEPVPVEDTFTKGYHVGAKLRKKRVLPVWETLWDGEATSGSFIGGNFFWLWQGTGKNLLSNGDVVRIAVDGVVSTLTVRGMTSLNGAVEAGNRWLEEGTGSDDGTDVYLWEYNSSLRFFTRKSYFGELPYVKFERATYSLPVYE